MVDALLTIGAKVGYAKGTTTAPATTGYVRIPGLTELPDLSSDPDTIDTTSLDNETNTSSKPGLKDTSSVISMPARFSNELIKMWMGDNGDGTGGVMGAYAELTDSDELWLAIDIKDSDFIYYVPFVPIALDPPTGAYNDAAEVSVKFTVDGDIKTSARSTTSIWTD